MKILLVMPNTTIFPVGMAYISSALKQASHHVDCIVFDSQDTLINKVREGYDFVATGGLSCEYAKIKRISDTAKQRNIKTIVGGGIVTSEPELMSHALNVDYSILGEGEETIVELLSCLKNSGDLSTVQGICYYNKGNFIKTDNRKQIDNLDSLPWPDYESFGFEKRFASMRSSDQYNYDVFDYPREYPLVASRSCPFLCTFCYHPSGDKYRQRSADSIIEELKERVPKYKINIVSIYDELFSNNKERVYEFCKRFKEFADSVSWQIKWSCQMRVTDLDDKMLETMRESGCYIVSYGFESYSPKVLKSMKKHIKPEQIHSVIHKTLNKKISIQGNFIFGDVAETMETAMETLMFWKEHPEAGIQLVPILACPNSELYQFCIKKGIIKDRLHFIKYDQFKRYNMTKMTSTEFNKMQSLLYIYTVKYSTCTTPIERTATSVKVKCPHCFEIVEYNNYEIKKIFYEQKMYCRSCRRRFYSVNAFYKYYTKYTFCIAVKYKIDTWLVPLKTKLKNWLKSYSIVWRLYQKKQILVKK
jgi:Fe-S oxidoreductase